MGITWNINIIPRIQIHILIRSEKNMFCDQHHPDAHTHTSMTGKRDYFYICLCVWLTDHLWPPKLITQHLYVVWNMTKGLMDFWWIFSVFLCFTQVTNLCMLSKPMVVSRRICVCAWLSSVCVCAYIKYGFLLLGKMYSRWQRQMR